jgi:hypothetical protein
MKVSDFKQGDRVWINANGCDPKCRECTKSHKPLKGIVVDKMVYVLHEQSRRYNPDYIGVIDEVRLLIMNGKDLVVHCKPNTVKALLPRLRRR